MIKITILVSFALLVALIVGGECMKNGKGKLKKSLKAFSTCAGKPLNLTSQLSSVEQCLNNRITEATGQLKNPNKGKKKEKLSRRLRNKCLSECEWVALGLKKSQTNGTSSNFRIDFEKALNGFPAEARGVLQRQLGACLNSSMVRTNMKKKYDCSNSRKLMNCFRRSVRQVCMRNNSNPNSTEENVSAPPTMRPGETTQNNNQTGSTSEKPTDRPDADDEGDDDDSDDEFDNKKTKATQTEPAPSTIVNTSDRITR